MTILYGISNCDTIKKAKNWLQAHNVDFEFHDYKKSGAELSFLKEMIHAHGFDVVVNKRGTTYRKLEQGQKDIFDSAASEDSARDFPTFESALQLLQNNTSMIKRPILVYKGKSVVGFKADEYENVFKSV